jgi:hypothetical protein
MWGRYLHLVDQQDLFVIISLFSAVHEFTTQESITKK